MVARDVEVSFRPSATAAYRSPGCRIDTLSCAAADIAHVSPPPTFAFEGNATGNGQREIDVNCLTAKLSSPRDGTRCFEKAVETRYSHTRRSVFAAERM